MAFFPLAVLLGLLGLLYSKPAGAGAVPELPPSNTTAHPGEVWTLRFHLEDPNHTISAATKNEMVQMLRTALESQGIGLVAKNEGGWMDDSTLALVVKYLKETNLKPGTSFSDPSGRSLTLTYAVQSPLN